MYGRGVFSILKSIKFNLTLKNKLIIASIAIPIMIFIGGLFGVFDTWYVHTKTVDIVELTPLLHGTNKLESLTL